MPARPLALGALPVLFALLATTARADGTAAGGLAYRLHAVLDPISHTVSGYERIHFVNHSTRPLRELWFHLYLNAFESDATVFMQESAGNLRGIHSNGRGSIEVTGLLSGDGADLLPLARTDAGAPNDRTEMRVSLPSPLAPGASLDLVVRFVSHLPPLFARSGHAGDFHVVAQWYPKLARLEPDGRWAHFPYHGRGEFYADFAAHTLQVTVPAAYVIGAVGQRVASSVRDGLRTERFVATDVHDTMFVASPHLEEHLGRQGSVGVRLLAPPGYGSMAERQLTLTERGLATYGSLYGPYPYPTLTVVVPPRGAEGGAGMEYPTLFLTDGAWFDRSLVRIDGADVTTAHELAHQWFQGLVATDEVRWPMLDEGLTSWAGTDLLRRIHGQVGSAFDGGGLKIDAFELTRAIVLEGHAAPPPGRPVTDFTDTEYGRVIYGRVPLVLETIGRVWGPQRLTRALGRYAREQRLRHPTPEALFSAFDATYWPGFSDAVLRPALMDGAGASVRLGRVHNASDGSGAEIRVERVGALPIPLWVEITYVDGHEERIALEAVSPRLTYRSPHPVRAVVVDPDGHDLLDPHHIADARRAEGIPPPASPWLARALTWANTLLTWVLP